MNRIYLKFGAVAVAFLLMASSFSGCSSNSKGEYKENTSTNSMDNKPDISKKVELVWYLIGDAHPDTPKVLAEFNKKLEKDLNCTLKLNFLTWNDWQKKYYLLLSTGERIDMVFASTWASFFKYAKQGAFMDLKDLLPTYAPVTWKTVPRQDWNDVSFDGKIFAVPSTYPEYTPNGLVYREDWRKQLGLPEIKDLDTLERYLEGVKNGMPDVIPIGGNAFDEISTLWYAVSDVQIIGGDEALPIKARSYTTPRKIIIEPFLPEYASWCKKMKTWVEKGYLSPNTLSSKLNSSDLVKAGKSAVAWNNPAAANRFISDQKKLHPDWEFGYFPFTEISGYAIPDLSINNGMAIPKSAVNPERSLMLLDKLRNDEEYYELMTWGIKGYHYDLVPNSKYVIVPAKGQDTKINSGYSIVDWGWRYEPNTKSIESSWKGFDELMIKFKAISRPNIFQAIFIDYDPVKAEYSAVNQIVQTYRKPLLMGLVTNVDESLKEYQNQLRNAGIAKLHEYVRSTTNDYFNEKGIK